MWESCSHHDRLESRGRRGTKGLPTDTPPPAPSHTFLEVPKPGTMFDQEPVEKTSDSSINVPLIVHCCFQRIPGVSASPTDSVHTRILSWATDRGGGSEKGAHSFSTQGFAVVACAKSLGSGQENESWFADEQLSPLSSTDTQSLWSSVWADAK